VFGTGPFQRGNVYGGTKFAGDDLRVPLVSSNNDKQPPVRVARERVFNPDALSKRIGSQSNDTASVKPPENQHGGKTSATGAVAAATPGQSNSSNTQPLGAAASHAPTTPGSEATGTMLTGPQPLPPDTSFASPVSYQMEASRRTESAATAWPPVNKQPDWTPDALRSQFDAAWEPGN
jgi:hypothetical protein